MSIQQMRAYLEKQYGKAWVASKPDHVIVAVYNRVSTQK